MTCVADVDNEDSNGGCLWVVDTRGYTVPHSVIKTQRTDWVCKLDPVLDSNGLIFKGSGVIYQTGIQAFLIQQTLQVTNIDMAERLIRITVITILSVFMSGENIS